jgi:hypothetical protein
MAVLGGLAIMSEMMNNGMMWGMGIGWLITGIIAVLVIAALIKYLFFR